MFDDVAVPVAGREAVEPAAPVAADPAAPVPAADWTPELLVPVVAVSFVFLRGVTSLPVEAAGECWPREPCPEVPYVVSSEVAEFLWL